MDERGAQPLPFFSQDKGNGIEQESRLARDENQVILRFISFALAGLPRSRYAGDAQVAWSVQFR